MNLAKTLRSITEDEAQKSYEDLKEGKTNGGLKTLDRYFFEHRLKTKTSKGKGRISFEEAWQDKNIMDKLTMICRRYGKEVTLQNQYAMFQLWWGSVNQFRPSIARKVYQEFQPSCIADPCAGWGGRCLAAISLGIDYIGCDTNINLREAYEEISTYGSSSVTMIYGKAEEVDWSRYNYDMVFTSPPYWTQEIYEGMPVYSSKNEWINNFLMESITRLWKGKSLKVMCLNLPDWLYHEIVVRWRVCDKILEMPYSGRKGGMKTEGIYCWLKGQERIENNNVL